MKKLVFGILAMVIFFGLSACGPSLEEGPCAHETEVLYDATLEWWDMVAESATSYGTFEVYLENYREPIVSWRALELTSTCDGAIADLMLTYLNMDPEDEDIEMVLYDILTFDLASTHVGE